MNMSKLYAAFYYFYFYFAWKCRAGSCVKISTYKSFRKYIETVPLIKSETVFLLI